MMRDHKDPIALIDISLSKNIIGSNAIHALVAEVCNYSLLRMLSISDVSIDAASPLKFFVDLKYNPHLTNLDLSSNEMPFVQDYILKDFIYTNTAIRHLKLSSC